jgi:hypothetical protein
MYRPEHWRQEEWNTPGMASRTNGQAPHGSAWSADPRSVRPILRSADPQVAPLRVCFIWAAVSWALRSVPGVHVLLRQLRRSGGPMDPCEVQVSRSDSSGLASFGLVAWLACMAPEVAATSWLRWRGMNHRRWVCHFFMLIFLQSHNLQGQVELHYS